MRLGQQTIHFYSKKAIPNILVADGSIFCLWFFRSGLLFSSSPPTLRHSLDFLRRFFCFYHPVSFVFAAVSSFSFPSPPTLRLSLEFLRQYFCLLPSHVSLLAAVSSSSSSSPPTLRRSLDFLRRQFCLLPFHASLLAAVSSTIKKGRCSMDSDRLSHYALYAFANFSNAGIARKICSVLTQ